MVVSKDSKRKRKSPPPPPIIESSPEMPKRTKVQAQRKFAQGQSAPSSSYNSALIASGSAGPSSTASESREPPTEILPNKRPKTEDFLTFLCFRGTNALPAHLDFLNQNKENPTGATAATQSSTSAPKTTENVETTVNHGARKTAAGTTSKTSKTPVSKTRDKANSVKCSESSVVSLSPVLSPGGKKNLDNSSTPTTSNKKTEELPPSVITFAVRKRAELIPERTACRGRTSERTTPTVKEKCNKSSDGSRRSVRATAVKDLKSTNNELDTDDELLSESKSADKHDANNSDNFDEKSYTSQQLNAKNKKGKAGTSAKKKALVANDAAAEIKSSDTHKISTKGQKSNDQPLSSSEPLKRPVATKDKQVKRIRQKEAPIFVPSPEPTGRMTRQRAFFEPVKVPPPKEEEKPDDESEIEKENLKKDTVNKEKETKEPIVDKVSEGKANKSSTVGKESNCSALPSGPPSIPDLNVFDFSSEDEEPLVKTLKTSKTRAKGTHMIKKNFHQADLKQEMISKQVAAPLKEPGTVTTRNVKLKKGKEDEIINETSKQNSNKSQSNDKQHEKIQQEVKIKSSKNKKALSRKKGSAETNATSQKQINKAGDFLEQNAPQKKVIGKQDLQKSPPPNNDGTTTVNNIELRTTVTARPSRKTKEAATIYMGIIGKKLQNDNNDNEDDDLSLDSFPELPNVREMEKLENEMKRNLTFSPLVAGAASGTSVNVKSSKSPGNNTINGDKSTTGKRGRPPKNAKQRAPLPQIKQEIEGVLLRKKENIHCNDSQSENRSDMVNSTQQHGDHSYDDDEDFLLNEEVNETKRKLEKNFSDSDDEPLAIKLHKPSEKNVDSSKRSTDVYSLMVSSIPLATSSNVISTSMVSMKEASTSFSTSPAEKKSSTIAPPKITHYLPVLSVATSTDSPFKLNKMEVEKDKPKLLTPPIITPAHVQQLTMSPTPTSAPYQIPAVRQINPIKSSQSQTPLLQHMASPIKYQTPPTTYPPPIEAYPSPKINPNFLTPKFDRNIERRIMTTDGSSISSTLPRQSTFPSPSPVKFDMSSTPKATATSSSPKTPVILPSTGTSSSDPLKDEIGSILAANLMPSKEESGKIFGIASVSLAQSSGPDNTKCTLGKCGSIHRPALGPVVPTESYLGEQLSSKERRKAKVNMTHEQIQKWLIECSSNPDEIQDDLDDDFDDSLRQNFATTPPPTRDDKESTSFSSSSKTTRDLGKSESAWSGKGPSLKATPVVVSKEENNKYDDAATEPEKISNNPSPGNLAKSLVSNAKQQRLTTTESPSTAKSKEVQKPLKSQEKLNETKASKNSKAATVVAAATTMQGKEKNFISTGKVAAGGVTNKVGATGKSSPITPTSKQQNKRKMASEETRSSKAAPIDSPKLSTTPTSAALAVVPAAALSSPKTQKRTPVYNAKLKETTTTSHKKKSPFSYAFGAFSADNEKSIYSFDKDDDSDGVTLLSKPSFRRQSGRDSHNDDNQQSTTAIAAASSSNLATSPKKKLGADKKENNASQKSSVLLTFNPEDNSKLVKVSLDTEKQSKFSTTTTWPLEKLSTSPSTVVANPAIGNDFDSDSEGHTFYIPLQGGGVSGANEGIQGVAVKLGRQGPDGPNQKVVMQATLVTKAQMGANSKPIPESMNVSEIVKSLLTSNSGIGATNTGTIPSVSGPNNCAATLAATAAATATATSSTTVSSSKSVPVGTVQPRFKSDALTSSTPAANPSGSGGLTRVNSSSSLFSGSNKSRGQIIKKLKDDTPIKMCNNTAFPRHDDPTQMVEAPIFRPTEKEFQDPMEFIERITPIAARFGICKIIPPSCFKPECRVSDDMRFTAYNQYVHKMLHRWGPSVKELSAIRKYLATQSILMNHPPWIGGMEVDLPRLYHTVQELGGLKEVIEKKKWTRVAEEMCIPKLAQDRVTKLDDIYCKYLLPYDTLSPSERQKLFDEVEADWAKREARARRNADRYVNTESVSNEDDEVSSEDDDESEEEVDGVSMECIVKGRSMPLSQFFRIARNTMALWFKNTEPTVTEVEAEFWRHVAVRDSHVCVHSGSIDSSGWGYGFPAPGPKGKGSTCARHPWNLKVLTNNAGSVLRSLGPVMGVTVPTLHVGMLFSACCWYRDPHGLSWIEYLHTGASKLWYGIPDDQSSNFRSALTTLIPTHCQNKTIWLPCDTVMVPPHMLTDRGVSLCRIEQKPGEFVVVFPRAYTSSVATGYVVSESVYFATSSWLELAKDDFRDIHDSCEPAMFSLEQLLFALGSDQRVTIETLSQMLPMINEVFEKETAAREQLKAAGVTSTEKIPTEKNSKSKKQQPIKSIENECDLCRANLYISMVKTDEGNIYCLQHALKNLNKGNIQAKQCKLIFTYNIEDIENLIKNLKERIAQKRFIANKKSK